ncbi:phytanoyl-CoA dioxygenase family protein [Zalerion maritima]|uniref:Phytanoyl-CoA dioxygenase family protein n=1 Tax=Zalerion maritima TaxID=339359 RepID=A0AAD5S1C2_9PEZI|nr:phytanoyl-CoA dioxygenase family protein [Zalerion maritima]
MPSATTHPAELRRVDFSNHAEIVSALSSDGGVILTNFTTTETVDRVNEEVAPWLARDKPWKGRLFPPETRRCSRLIGRSDTARREWLADDRLFAVLGRFLGKTTRIWYDDVATEHTTEPILSTANTIDVRPGAAAQRLHRDDKVHHADHDDMTEAGYKPGADVSISLLVPGVESTSENGATLVIPGSHLWGDERPPKREEASRACMKPGEALMFLGSMYHAGGANVTKDQHRPVHGLFFCRGNMRAEENVYLGFPEEQVKEWSDKELRRTGYAISSPNLGFVDFVSPMHLIKGTWKPEEHEFLVDLD